MITVIYPFRNRDLQRVRNSLDSLVAQSDFGFKVIFVNYGSTEIVSVGLENLLADYSFVEYVKHPTQHQLWSKSIALNSVIKKLKGGYCFVADVDLIFSPDFMSVAKQIEQAQQLVYFQVGFLDKTESKKNVAFSDYRMHFKSESGATGLSLLSVDALQKVGGFDEFFHFWGAEDTDLHNRLTMAGYDIKFYDKEVLLLHQWHPSYRSEEQNKLTVLPRLSGVVRLNHEHLKHNLAHHIIHPNSENWGNLPTASEVEKIEKSTDIQVLTNRKEVIDHFLFVHWPQFSGGVLAVRFEEDVFQHAFKYKLKKILGKSVPEYYSLKEINDQLLLHLISFHRNKPYAYQVDLQKKCISFWIIM